ncbi:hypothetical protein DYB37_006879 [Aphanomyces astaci]|uniref:Uncharacterized protein n=1 Tax=Aphanomyces astaci TaxID=112090 RepID=A0A3R7C5L1_APHAT|nr:hypothetical protein DYB35_006341 [Aphanomyces astaci]RHZ34310.1 hypothetical protein DYB37_006879 [Aphanomyces astaci]
MKTQSGYQRVKVGKISDAKLKKALKGGSLTLSSAELKPNDFDLLLHPANAKKVIAAQKASKDIVKNVATPFVGEDIANAGRSLVQSMTGKGFPKGSQAAKDHMAKLRSMKKSKTVGGSFRLS